MSSLTKGTYVLKTATDANSVYEYRVVCTSEIDNIYGIWEDVGHFSPNREMIVKYFGPSRAFIELEEALSLADSIETDMNETEQGICIISDFQEYKYAEFLNEKE